MQIKIVKIPQSITGIIDDNIAKLIVGMVLQAKLDDEERDATISVMEITIGLLKKHYMKAQVEFARLGLKESTIILLPDEYQVI